MATVTFPALEPAEVRAISDRLASDWGIKLRSHREFIDDLASLSDQAAVSRMWKAHDIAASAEGANRSKVALDREMPYFRAIAVPVVHGIVTSRHRAWLIDAIALTIALVRQNGLKGNILDVGCHAGHVSSVLAHRLPNKIVGIDPLREAIEFGRGHPAKHPEVSLRRAGIPFIGAERFSAILSIDAIPQSQKGLETHLLNYGRNLEENGIAIVTSASWYAVDLRRVNRTLRKAGLAFEFVTVLGGYGGASENEGNSFAAQIVAVLRKGEFSPLPESQKDLMRMAEANWAGFSVYANDPNTPDAEKTQAFFAARFGGSPVAPQ